MIIDVDGTMTDGGIYYDNLGNEVKKFNTQDAAAFFALQQLKIGILVITGRSCKATEKRMNELGVQELYQGVKDKYHFIKSYLNEKGITKDDVGYIGDDLNDYKSMELASWIACPQNGCEEIKKIANYVSNKKGGDGAVRDIIEKLLREEKVWEIAINNVY